MTDEVTKKVTHDIMVMLRDQGVHLRSPSNTPSPVGGRKSSCASASDAVERDHIDGLEVTQYLDTIDLLIEPTPCSLVINPRGYQMEVARGRVFPQQTELCSQPVMEHYAVVHIDYVHPPLSPKVRTLGHALYKRVQWRRGQIVISKVLSSPKLSRPPLPVSSKSNLKDFVIGDEKAT